MHIIKKTHPFIKNCFSYNTILAFYFLNIDNTLYYLFIYIYISLQDLQVYQIVANNKNDERLKIIGRNKGQIPFRKLNTFLLKFKIKWIQSHKISNKSK